MGKAFKFSSLLPFLVLSFSASCLCFKRGTIKVLLLAIMPTSCCHSLDHCDIYPHGMSYQRSRRITRRYCSFRGPEIGYQNLCMVPLSTALADLTAIDGGPLHSHAHNAPHKHTKYNIDKSSKDKHGVQATLGMLREQNCCKFKINLGKPVLRDLISHKTKHKDCQNIRAVAMEES